MKKNLFKSLFVAAAAMAFVSCVHDDTLDGSKGLYNGPKKTISLSASIAETRTELVDHAILWSDTDTFGLITSADGTTILENISVPYTRKNADNIEIEVAESAKYIYGYYPYNANLDTEAGLANFVIEIPDTYKAGTTDSDAYAPSIDGMFPLLTAKTELPEDDGNVALVFKTADACLVEFNIYGGTDDFEQLISLDLNLEADGGLGASGDIKYDLTGDEPVWSEMYANGYGFVVSFDWYEDPSTFQINYPKLKVEKKDGIKVYGVVHKGTYESNQEEDLWYSPKVTIKTNIQTYICKFSQLDCSADGLTVNINLSSSAIEHPAALAEIISVDAPNTFSADVKIKVDYQKIDWIAVNATNTNDIEQTNGATTKGFDSKEFISNAKLSYTKFEQGANLPSYDNMPYMIYTGSMLSDLVNKEDGTITVSDDFLHFLGNQTEGVFDTPGDSNPFAPNTSYTVAVYVKPQSSYAKDYPEEIIYTYEWTTPAIKYDGTASVTITDPVVSGANATATVSATNCSKIAAFAMLIDEAALDLDGRTKLTDDQRVDEIRISDLLYWKDNKFKVYEGDITLTYDNMLVGSRYMFIAVGIDENGLITKPVYKIAQPGSVEMTDEATITDVKIEPQTSLEWLPITITATNASEVRFLAYHSEDYQGLNGTIIQSRLMNLSQGSGGWSKNSGKSGDEFTFYNGQGIYLSGNQDVSSDSEVDATENPGGNTYYIFFAPVVEGSNGWKLGHIQLLTGNGSSYQLYDITANGNNVSGNYVAAKRTELENAGGGDEEETPNIWGGTAEVTLAHMRLGETYLSYSSYATNFQKGWLLKLASEDEQMKEQATEYRNTYESSIYDTMDEYIFKLRDEAFKNFAETQAPESQYILETVNTISGTATKYMYPAKTDSSDGWAAGDIYMFVSQDTDGLLCGTWLVLASDNVGVVRKFK